MKQFLDDGLFIVKQTHPLRSGTVSFETATVVEESHILGEPGLGNGDIAEELEGAASGRRPAYWTTVALARSSTECVNRKGQRDGVEVLTGIEG